MPGIACPPAGRDYQPARSDSPWRMPCGWQSLLVWACLHWACLACGCLGWLLLPCSVYAAQPEDASNETAADIAAQEAYTPQSPRVRAAVDRALAYLEANPDRRPGGKALGALAYLKAGAPKDHPQILAGVEAVRETLQNEPYSDDVYTNGISLILLAELDAAEYRPEIDKLLSVLLARQKPHGGWGYDRQRTGDTSMTPHAVLSLWAASEHGVNTPTEAWDKVAGWLVRTQDPTGAWGYQGADSGSYSELVPQSQVRHSLTASGISCLYVYQAYMGFHGAKNPGSRANLSAALKEIKPQSNRPVRSSTLNPSVVLAAQQRGSEWLADNYKINIGQYSHYYLYALERYESFREVVEGELTDPSPRWYREGAQWLIDTQHEEGWWTSYALAGKSVDTALAVLFLVRSAQQSVDLQDRLGAGRLAGGKQLLDGGAAVPAESLLSKPRPKLGPAEELLAAIENPDHPEHGAAIEGYRQLAMQGDEALLDEQERRLRQLAGGRDPELRWAAVRALGRRQDLSSVPILIYALSDPDVRVFLEAREGLRFISRKFEGVGVEGVPTEDERRTEIARWQQWYRSVQPDAEFIR